MDLWSSCQALLGQVPAPAWLDTLGLHGYLLGRPAVTDADFRLATLRYAEFVDAANDDGASFWQQAVRAQVFLANEAFVRQMQAQALLERQSAKDILRVQRLLRSTWPQCLAACDSDRNRAISMGYRQGGFTMPELA